MKADTFNLHFKGNVVLLLIVQSFKHVLNLEINQTRECGRVYIHV